MRLLATVVAALCAAAVSAQQNNAISVPEGASTLEVTAGTPLTIEWTNPSSGTITIKLQQDPIVPDGGITLASGVPASDGTATLQIPAADDVNSFQYTIEIIDDTNSDNINFSPNFGIQGATGTQVGSASTASSTGTASTGSASASGSTSTDSTASAATTSSSSDSTSTSTDTSSSSETSASTTSSESRSATSSSSAASETTSAPDSNGNAANGLKVQGGLLAMAVGLVAVL